MATIKQQLAYQKVLENKGNISKAMRESGYPPTTAKNPQQLTRSKGFQELLNQAIPEGLATLRHKQLLNKKTKDGQPETKAVLGALDMYHKLKGSYAPVKHLNINLKMSPEQKAKAKDAVRQALNDSK